MGCIGRDMNFAEMMTVVMMHSCTHFLVVAAVVGDEVACVEDGGDGDSGLVAAAAVDDNDGNDGKTGWQQDRGQSCPRALIMETDQSRVWVVMVALEVEGLIAMMAMAVEVVCGLNGEHDTGLLGCVGK